MIVDLRKSQESQRAILHYQTLLKKKEEEIVQLSIKLNKQEEKHAEEQEECAKATCAMEK